MLFNENLGLTNMTFSHLVLVPPCWRHPSMLVLFLNDGKWNMNTNFFLPKTTSYFFFLLAALP